MLKRFAASVQAARAGHRQYDELRRLMLEAASDGVLTDTELLEIENKRSDFGVSAEDFARLKVELLAVAVNAVKADGQISAEEARSLDRLIVHFDVPSMGVNPTAADLFRLRLLYEVENGNLPTVAAPGIALKKNETAHWVEPASLIEEQVVKSEYVGRSSGFSVRVAKGLTYRVGSTRGRLVKETGMVPVSAGRLVITDKRILFAGTKKSVEARWDKLVNVEVFGNGLVIHASGKAKPAFVKYEDPTSAELVAAITAHALNHFLQ